MAVNVETLEKLERRITLTLPATTISAEVESRLKKLSRTVKADGFRPGKVPMSVVAQRYGYSVQYEVHERQGRPGLRAGGQRGQAARRRRAADHARRTRRPKARSPSTPPSRSIPRSRSATCPQAEVERVATEVTDAAIDKTIDILRKQRRTFQQRPAAEGAADGDRVTIDFEGKIDGEPFDGGKAEGFQFVIGEGQMLEQFDKAVRGMKAGEIEDLPAAVPGRLPGQGRRRQGSRLHWSR